MQTDQQGHVGDPLKGVDKKVRVEISTTAGLYPAEGFDEIPTNQKVHVQLEKAARQLGITNTTGWIATVTAASGRRIINIASSYSENALVDEVTIDWGPSEGGGGSNASGCF